MSLNSGDTLEIRNNDDYAIYQIESVTYVESQNYNAPDDFISFSLGAMISSGGNSSFSLNNDYSFVFDRSYSPVYESTSTASYSNNDFTFIFSSATSLTINSFPSGFNCQPFETYSVWGVNHHAGNTFSATSDCGTPTTINIGTHDIIEIFITHNWANSPWNAYEITIIDRSHFFETRY